MSDYLFYQTYLYKKYQLKKNQMSDKQFWSKSRNSRSIPIKLPSKPTQFGLGPLQLTLDLLNYPKFRSQAKVKISKVFIF